MAWESKVSGAGALDKAEVARRFPVAVQFAALMREAFGDDVRLIYAKNAEGDTLGKPSDPPAQMKS